MDFSSLEHRLVQLEASIRRIERVFGMIFNSNLVDEKEDHKTTQAAATLDQTNDETSRHLAANIVINTERTDNILPTVQPVVVDRKPITIRSPCDVSKPRYDGRCEYFTAAEFLDQFDQYVCSKNQEMEGGDRIAAVYECLQGAPKLWFRAFKYRFDSWETFKRLFLMRFWGCFEQRDFMNKLMNGKYTQRGKQPCMAAYFTRFVINAQYLELPPTEDKLIRLMAGHFPTDVQELLEYNQDIATAYNTLVMMDQTDKVSSPSSHNDRSGGGSCNRTV